MLVVVRCPECKEEYEVDNSHPKVQCPCGTVIDVPPTQPQKTALKVSSPTKDCPQCQSGVPNGNILCTNCGFNFQTGAEFGAQPPSADPSGDIEMTFEAEEEMKVEEEETLPFTERYKPLIKLAVFGLLLGIGGLIYLAATGKQFGISGDAPIGVQADIESYLQECGMVKHDRGWNPLERAQMNGTCILYEDVELRKQTKGMYDQYVFLVLDESGKLVVVGGAFDSDDIGIKGGRTYGFLETLWKDLEGDVKAKTISNSAVHAKWSQTTTTLGVLQFFNETVAVSLNGSEYQKVVDVFTNQEEEGGAANFGKGFGM